MTENELRQERPSELRNFRNWLILLTVLVLISMCRGPGKADLQIDEVSRDLQEVYEAVDRIEEKLDRLAGLSDPIPGLIRSAYSGNRAGVTAFLDDGGEVNAQDKRGRTALYAAAAGGHLDLVKLLVENGADPDIAPHQTNRPVWKAAVADHPEVVEYLLPLTSLDADRRRMIEGYLAESRSR